MKNVDSNEPEISQVACGMYTSTAKQEQAWQALFSHFADHFIPLKNVLGEASLCVLNDTRETAYRSSKLFIGHTCGYPYVTRWHSSHDLVCVPIFAVDGCEGNQYSSWFITHGDHKGAGLGDFRGKVVALNGHNSNSGMNVLRYEISQLADGQAFFSESIVSGGHFESIKLVEQKVADLAAIDSVTFAHLKDAGLFDSNAIHVLGQSQPTAGLPFIIPKTLALELDVYAITEQLNLSLTALDSVHRAALGLDRFETIGAEQYAPIKAMEDFAMDQGYPRLA